MRTLLVSKTTGAIYELLEMDGDRMHLSNLSSGEEGWIDKEHHDKLFVSTTLTAMQEKNETIIELIKTLNLQYERD